MLRFLLAFVACVWVHSALAGGRVALVLTVGDYQQLRSLKNPVGDGEAVASLLRDLKYDVAVEVNPDLRQMRQALEDFAQVARRADVALVYFAGHGVDVRDQNRLMPADADAASIDALINSSLLMDDVLRQVRDLANTTIVVLDSCRTNPFVGSIGGRGAVGIAGHEIRYSFADPLRALADMGEDIGSKPLLVIYAAKAGTMALDGEGSHSPFATSFLKAFGNPGLELRDMAQIIRDGVIDLTDGEQQPFAYGTLPTQAVYLNAPTN